MTALNSSAQLVKFLTWFRTTFGPLWASNEEQ